MSLLLEQLALDCSLTPQLKAKKETDCYDFEPTTSIVSPVTTTAQQLEILDNLGELYAVLKEDDLWAGLWQKRAKFSDTNLGISYELQGYYEKAQGCYELAMNKAKTEPINSMNCFSELKVWEEHWIK
jgi:transformation/transcription domain-associated protein